MRLPAAALHLALGLALCWAAGAHAQPDSAEGDDYAERMERARAHLWSEHGGQLVGGFDLHRLENRWGDERGQFWEGSASYGGDISKFWLDFEGERSDEHDEVESFQLEAFYDRAVSAFWNVRAGVRRDQRPQPRTWAALRLAGLAPQWVEIEATLLANLENGALQAELTAEYELNLSRLVKLALEAEAGLGLTSDREAGVGAGLGEVELAAALHFVVSGQFQPYVGLNWERAFGESADFARAEGGEGGAHLTWIAGLHFWF